MVSRAIARSWGLSGGGAGIAATLELIPRNNFIAQIGNSQVEQGTNQYVGQEAAAIRQPMTKIGGFQAGIESRLRGRVICPPTMNFGLAGDTTVAAGDNPGINTRMGACLATDAAAIVALLTTNDRGSAANFTATQSIENVENYFIQPALNANRYLFLVAEYPRTGLGATQAQYHKDVHNWLLLQNGRGLGKVIVIDPWPSLLDPGSDIEVNPTYSDDGLHLNTRGNQLVGNLIGDAISSLYQDYPPVLLTSAADLYDSVVNITGNLLPNGMMTGSIPATGSATGTIPTSWTTPTVATGMAMNCTVASTVNGKSDWLKIEFTGTPTAANPTCILNADIPLADVAAGNLLEGLFELYVETATNAQSLRAQCSFTFSGGVIASQGGTTLDNTANGTGIMTSGPYSVVGRIPRFTIDDGTPATARFRFNPQFTQNVAVTLTVYIRAVSVRKVLS